MESSDETCVGVSRLKTNVIDYRPITAPLTSPRLFSRPSSPTSIRSPKIPKEEIYRSILERADFDMDKLIENLPKYLRDDNNNNNGKSSTNFRKETSTPIPFFKSSVGSLGPQTRPTTSGRKVPKSQNRATTASNSNSNNYSSLLASRPLSRGTSGNFSGTSTPSSSRREENSLEMHTKRIGFQLTSSGKTFGSFKITDSGKVQSVIPKQRWRTSGAAASMSVPSTPTTAAANSHRMKKDELNNLGPSTTKALRSGPATKKLATLPKRPCTSVEAEKENPGSSRKDVFLKHVYVVHGSVVAFKSFGYENFTNWFGDETMLNKDKKHYDFFHRELDVWGYTNREITMKLFCGNKLLVEASRPARGKLPAKKFKETVILPNHLSVESLIVCRARSGRLIIQENTSSYVPSTT